MLVPGGVYEQPAGLWLARNSAGSVWLMLEKIEHSKDPFDDESFTKDDRKMHLKILRVDVDRSRPDDAFLSDDDESDGD